MRPPEKSREKILNTDGFFLRSSAENGSDARFVCSMLPLTAAKSGFDGIAGGHPSGNGESSGTASSIRVSCIGRRRADPRGASGGAKSWTASSITGCCGDGRDFVTERDEGASRVEVRRSCDGRPQRQKQIKLGQTSRLPKLPKKRGEKPWGLAWTTQILRHCGVRGAATE